MGDISLLGTSAYDKRAHDRYDRYQVGRSADQIAKAAAVGDETTNPLLEDSTPPEAPAPLDPAAFFGGVGSAMGMDAFMPNGGSAADALNQAMQAVAPYMLDPELAAQLIGMQVDQPEISKEAVDGAMNALSQNYDVTDATALFKKLDVYRAGQIMPWDLQRAVAAGGGTIEQASALFKTLDPFGNGLITIQQLTANLPAAPGSLAEETAEDPATDPAPEASILADNSAIGGLAALSQSYNFGQPPQDLFLELDTDFDGMLSQADIVNAVTAGGGTPEAGDALYAQLDPANTGVVTQWQFASNLFPRIEVPNLFV